MPDGAADRRSTADPELGNASDIADVLRQQTHSYVEKRKADTAKVISDVANAIRDTGAGLDALPQLKPFFDQAALGIDEFADGISRRTFSEMYYEVHAAIRRRPALATAAAALAGFALFRVMQMPVGRPITRSRAVVVTAASPRTPDR